MMEFSQYRGIGHKQKRLFRIYHAAGTGPLSRVSRLCELSNDEKLTILINAMTAHARAIETLFEAVRVFGQHSLSLQAVMIERGLLPGAPAGQPPTMPN